MASMLKTLDKLIEMADKQKKVEAEFSRMFEERYGFNFRDADVDPLIDAVDGQGSNQWRNLKELDEMVHEYANKGMEDY